MSTFRTRERRPAPQSAQPPAAARPVAPADMAPTSRALPSGPAGHSFAHLSARPGGVSAQAAAARRPNRTGLPDGLKDGIESLSGVSLDSLKVHYNAPQPARINALAYAQGAEIHVGPGQERHLPHEAWHVVQQAQGRVQPTTQTKEGVPVNVDAGLEHEAEVMGARSAAHAPQPRAAYPKMAAALGLRGAGVATKATIQRYPPKEVGKDKWVDDDLDGQEFKTEAEAKKAYFKEKNVLPGYLPKHDWDEKVQAGRELALSGLGEGTPATKILEDLAKWREQAANESLKILELPVSEGFGKPREKGAETPIRADTYGPEAVKQYSERRKGFEEGGAETKAPSAWESTLHKSKEAGTYKEVAVWGEADDEQQNIDGDEKDDEKDVYPKHLTTAEITDEVGEERKVGRWLHTAADGATTLAAKIEAIMARIDALQAKALDATAADDIIAKIAEIHWLLAQAMPWERGAASIAEVYTDALKLSKGIKLIKVFDKFKPDIAAFLMTLTEFISAHREAYKKEEK